MASTRGVVASLKILGRAFAGTIDDARVEVYAAALEDLSDEQLATATARVVKTHTGEYIPPPAIIRRAAGADQPAVLDVASAVRRIEQLAIYNPAVGMIYPSVRVVREQLGDAVAYAYAAAGGRLFSDDTTGQAIARREFQKAFEQAARTPGAVFPVLGVSQPYARLSGGSAELMGALGDDAS